MPARKPADPNLPSLTAALATTTIKKRIAAIRDMGKSGNPAAVPYLVPALSDSHPAVRCETALALGRLEDAVPYLRCFPCSMTRYRMSGQQRLLHSVSCMTSGQLILLSGASRTKIPVSGLALQKCWVISVTRGHKKRSLSWLLIHSLTCGRQRHGHGNYSAKHNTGPMPCRVSRILPGGAQYQRPVPCVLVPAKRMFFKNGPVQQPIY